MKIYENPDRKKWDALIERPVIKNEALTDIVKGIMNDVKSNGDGALINYTNQFDGVALSRIAVSKKEMDDAIKSVSKELKNAIDLAKKNIEKFHDSQKEAIRIIETVDGVKCWRKNVAIERVGLYIPGGSAPLFSTVLMLGIPAKIAGCKEAILCSPPDKKENINPIILYVANLVGITKVFKVGGAQAIAAMAFGTTTIPKVNKVFGPGNQYVTKAKEVAQYEGVAIDIPAGPSEVLIIADETCVPEFVASDLLSQAEHGEDSQVILLSTDETTFKKTLLSVQSQLENLPRKAMATVSLKNSQAILFNSMEQCIDFSNFYAPEHLIIASEKADNLATKITNAGSVFLGNYSCESVGDYASGTNHTLPTNGLAKSYSGVSLDSFIKKITFQKLSKRGLKNIGPAIESMAEAEELFGHKNAVSIRLKTIK